MGRDFPADGKDPAKAATDFVRMADQVGICAWMYDAATDLTLPTRAFCDLFGQPRAGRDRFVSSDPFRAQVHPDDVSSVDAAFQRAAANGEPEVAFTHRLLPAERGQERWLRAKGQLIGAGRDDAAPLFVGTVADITEERRLAERLTTLGQEASHRIKNNLSMVASMLALEGNAAAHASTRRRFERACERIRAIADIHDLVARADGAEVIDFGDYLSAVCRATGRATQRDGIEVRCASVPAALHVDTCVSLALLVNEYVTNAVQHAFPNGRTGRVAVSARRHREGGPERLAVEIADDGVGKADGTEGSVGSLITRSVARQIGATVSERRGAPGHVVTIELPLAP